jgi:hypothetical protein
MEYLSLWKGSYISRAAVIGKKLMTFFSNCTGMAAIVLRGADVAGHGRSCPG